MVYIITYTEKDNNTENDIIKLSGNNKINSIIDFCKTKKSNDIICYVNDLDVIIADKKEILDKYYYIVCLYSSGFKNNCSHIISLFLKLGGKLKKIKLLDSNNDKNNPNLKMDLDR